MKPDVSGWTKFGSTVNADFYEVADRLIAVVPHEGSSDDEVSARASVSTQLAYLRERSIRAGVLVFMDGVAEQSAAARAVYRDAPDPAFQACFALVGGTVFGRAVASLFVGLAPPRVPTRFFANQEEAVAWARTKTTGT